MLAQKYAQALYRAAEGETAGHTEEYVKNLTALLRRKGHVKLLPSILKEYKKLLKEKEGAVIAVARESDSKMIEEAKEAYKKYFNDTEPRVRVNERLVGGFRITSGTKLFDASYKNALRKLYWNMIS